MDVTIIPSLEDGKFIDSELWEQLPSKVQCILKEAGYRVAVRVRTSEFSSNNDKELLIPEEARLLLQENGFVLVNVR